MRRRNTRERKGVALLLVLWLVALLAMVTMAASGAARSSGDLVSAQRARATSQAMAESGIAIAASVIGDSLQKLVADSGARDLYLNALDAGVNGGPSAIMRFSSDTIDNGAFVFAVVDVSARLDVNEAGEEQLMAFLSQFTQPGNASALARRIAARVRGDGAVADSAATAAEARDSLVRALLGRSGDDRHLRHPFESLDELSALPGFDAALLEKVRALLTVDGDAHINRKSAPRTVLVGATGSLVDAPTRLLVVSRGWQLGHPLTHEIQAVYDVNETGLHLVRWRERTL